MSIDNLEMAVEHKLMKQLYSNEQPQDCIECGRQISSARQNAHKGTDVCDQCAERSQ